MTKLRNLSLVLIGVVLGVFTLYFDLAIYPLIVIGGFVCLGGAAMAVGYHMLKEAPLFSVAVMQLGLAVPVGLIALTTMATTWLATQFPPWLARLGANSDLATDADTISGILLGALGSFVAALWLEDAEQAAGWMWPSHWIKAAFLKAFTPEAEGYLSLPQNARFQSMAFVDDAGGGISGWGPTSARERLAMMDEIRAEIAAAKTAKG